MSKLGSDGKPIYREDGKVMKGPNYFKPRYFKNIELSFNSPIKRIVRNIILYVI